MSHLERSLPVKAGGNTHLRGRAAGLIISCPVCQDNPADCPLHAVRQLSLRERYRWLEALPPEQMRKLLDQHSECIRRKELAAGEPPGTGRDGSDGRREWRT